MKLVCRCQKESYRHDSRKPVVENGRWKKISKGVTYYQRYGFCLNGDHFGELLDPFNGLQDLEDRLFALL